MTTTAQLAIEEAPALSRQPRWPAGNAARLRAIVAERGAVLIRGLGVVSAQEAASLSQDLAGPLLAELEGFAPRDSYPGGVYSGTTWPPDQPMCMHHELSYVTAPPGVLVFSCLRAPATGGATALADGAAVLADLPPDLVRRFREAGWELRRTHNDVVGVPWHDAYGSHDRATVEDYCQRHGIGFRWDPAGGLHTRRRLPAVLSHPACGAEIWFNQIAFLNEWTMEPAVRDYLTCEFGPDGLPFNTCDGIGGPLDAATVEEINEVYATHTVREPWQAGDVLMIDNLRMAHSREPGTGAREIVAALAAPFSRS